MHTPDEPQAPELDALMQDKVETHCRQQLSAMLDGALAPDQAKFLLRRLQHDHVLAGCWERWQLCGDLMRGGAPALLPADFAQRVSAALTAEEIMPVARSASAADAPARAGWKRWRAPAALAASVAAVALLVAQRAPDAARPDAAQSPAVAQTQSAPAAPAPSMTDAGAAQATPAAQTAAAAATLLAAAEVPRRAAARRNRAAPARTELARVAQRQDGRVPNVQFQSQPASIAPASLAPAAVSQVNAPLLARQAPVRDPLLGEGSPAARPWPRAVLPGLGQGAFNVDLSGGDAGPLNFEGFEPQLPLPAESDPPSSP